MTPEQALALTKTLVDIYADATARLLELIARSLAKGMDRPRWAEERLAETLRLRRNAQRIVDAMQRHGTQQVLEVLEDAYRGGRLTPLAQPGMTAVSQRSVAALAADTNRLLTNTGPRVLRWTEDVYRQTIADTIGSTVVGADTRAQAAARALDRFATQGVTGLTDATGRRWRLESYVEMATRTAAGQAHLEGTLDRYEETGVELVIVSDSPEECPACRPFEGKILSLTPLPQTPALPAGFVYAGTHADARAAGLHHPNCTHRITRFTPGLTDPMEATENPDGYLLRQRQRELERRVRESKRRVAALEPLGPIDDLRRQKALLARRRADLNGFNAEHGRKKAVSARRTSLTSL